MIGTTDKNTIENILVDYPWFNKIPSDIKLELYKTISEIGLIDLGLGKVKKRNLTGVAIGKEGLCIYRDGFMSSSTTPSIITPTGDHYWHLYGKLHREDGPAEIRSDIKSPYTAWYNNGELHREGGPAIIFHRADSIEAQEWFVSGIRHNPSGPAVIGQDGESYFINGIEVQEEEVFGGDLNLVHSDLQMKQILVVENAILELYK